MTGGGRRRPRRGVAVLSLVAVTAPLACGGDGGAGGATAGSSRPSSVATVTDGAPTSMERETDVGQEAKEPTKSVTTTKTAPGPPTTPPSADHPPTSVPATPTTTATTGTLSTTMGSPPPGVTQGGPGSATRLSASSGCEGTPPRDVVRMRWQPSGAGRQRIDVTVLDNGFQPGTFESSHVLGAGESSLRWDHSRGEATHYWRVVTLVSGRWVASQTASFEGPGCVGSDFQPR